MIQRMKLANQVTLTTIIYNNDTLSKDMYYYFEGVVDRIENKLSLWYDACIKGSTSVFKTKDTTNCNKCKEENVETNPRVVLNIVHGSFNATITMFEEDATAFIGCTVLEYIKSVEEVQNMGPYHPVTLIVVANAKLCLNSMFRWSLCQNKTTTYQEFLVRAQQSLSRNP
ncbi:uracil phosphoribosyltransferase [Striga asiatica]|uniref:Uracil phosphoribosyltransferase n=1 Tax=Striga asiatica TaxID=4170 RepID=A0A5A7P2F9_STRAF|nr:uracil phosphoribosyltransferase [Striga asiatica]